MKTDLLSFRPGFRLSVSNARSQAAVMVLAVGGQEGGPDNLHSGADQWLYVVEGSGIATINGHKNKLKAGTIVLIEAGDRHEIRNTGRTLLKTVNVYVPPAIATKRQSFRPVAAPPEHSPMARPSKVPKQLQPMLATLIDAPFDSKDWVFENKWDGFRLVAKIENQSVTLY